jgi:peptidoglycan/LPS O-acetylase OafA/YrhL
LPIERPTWLPKYLPELDGLRGLAILWVVIYHCHPRLEGTWLYGAAIWGWAGVLLFFILSGFLITSILLTTRDQPQFFHNFHARRALRIWPLYILLLIVVYLNAPWFIGPSVLDAIKTAPWLVYIFFLQNLFHFTMPPALQPTWALAIEEQYYFVWAPLVKWLRRPWMLAVVLVGALVLSPALRLGHHPWLTPTHTLIHLDGIALGSLMAIGMHTLRWSRRTWLVIGLAALPAGIAAAGTIAGGTAFLDSALAVGFSGLVLVLIALTGSRDPVSAALRSGPLAFYGRISYGLYMSHIAVFIYFGWFDAKMNAYGVPGNLAVVGFRLVVCTLVAALLWYGIDAPMLKLKKRFEHQHEHANQQIGGGENQVAAKGSD